MKIQIYKFRLGHFEYWLKDKSLWRYMFWKKKNYFGLNIPFLGLTVRLIYEKRII